jgi:hypothetical protein
MMDLTYVKAGKIVMKIMVESFQPLVKELKQLRFKKLIEVVPSDLKVQFDQLQLNNSLYMLKLLGVVTVLYNILNWPIYIFCTHEINPMLFQKIIITDLIEFLITLLFFY